MSRDHEREVADDRSAAEEEEAVPTGGVRIPTFADWASVLAKGCVAHGIQLPLALRWIELESGGNPCAIGYPPAHGPDGAPREMGIAQFYNPDDMDLLTPPLSGSELRAYCAPGDQHESWYKGKKIRGFSSRMIRPMTRFEMQRQADAAIALIVKSMKAARRDLTTSHAGSAWAPGRRNYWTLVKLQHGLPQISRQGIPAVTKHLGRPPRDWGEFRRTLASVKLDARTEQKYRSSFDRILDNAEACASAFSEESIA